MRMKSLVQDAQETQRAMEMIELGARMQMLESETGLSRERLLKLYKEIRGESPPKGMLPFSTDWFIPWQQNVHASLFMSLLGFMNKNTSLRGLDATLKAYRLYRDHAQAHDLEEVLSLTRAWTLVRFFDAKMLQLACCTKCGGGFVAHAFDPTHDYVCGLCNVPARAGKGKRAGLRDDAVAGPKLAVV
ncbi:MAG: flagellar transcriptional regulator FlhC [Moraxellaceae bacterium]|nr:flagellar transcriptional regulator FlhC [Moraxellaceae bacterium]